MATHKELDIWKLAIELAVDIYKYTKSFPGEEKFGLVSQMRRCAVSIPSNIAEGAARQGDKENIHFIYISLGSIAELDTQLILAERLGFGNSTPLIDRLNIIKAKTIKYLQYLKGLNKG